MNVGTKIAWQALNPNSKAVRFGVVCSIEADTPGNVLILAGCQSLSDDDETNPRRPAGGYDVVSIAADALTIVP